MNNKKLVSELKANHKSIKNEINNRTIDFQKTWNTSELAVFHELCFCLCTPQSKAITCNDAINRLVVSGKLLNGSEKEIEAELRGVRFKQTKSKRIFRARKELKGNSGIPEVKKLIDPNDITKTRELLVSSINGFGYKEASHFLRNIGFGKDIAILDRHILKNLKMFNVIDEVPKSTTRKKYLEIEEKMRVFAKSIDISLQDLDMLFWSKESGLIFK